MNDDFKFKESLKGVVLECGFSDIAFLAFGETSVVLKAVDLKRRSSKKKKNVVLKIPYQGNCYYNMLFYEYNILSLDFVKSRFVVQPIAFIKHFEK
jgi:hypothetical protein